MSIQFVAFPPQIVQLPHEVNVTADQMASLPCSVTRKNTLPSETYIETVWLDYNNNIISNNSILGITGPINTTATNITSRLAVSNIRTSQAGIYTCVANMTIPGVVEDHQVGKTSVINIISKRNV